MHFEKVTYKEFDGAFIDMWLHQNLDKALGNQPMSLIQLDVAAIWRDIQLPSRATVGSAGYDFSFPMPLTICNTGLKYRIPTGIRWVAGDIEDRLYMNIYPRSGLGSKFTLREPNVVSVIDSDYCLSPNQGHIYVTLVNEGTVPECNIDANYAYAQGIISKYVITDDDKCTGTRNGGFGSTSRK